MKEIIQIDMKYTSEYTKDKNNLHIVAWNTLKHKGFERHKKVMISFK